MCENTNYTPPSCSSLSNLKTVEMGSDDTCSYAKIHYGEFIVTIMKKNCYINATKLCISGGKSFSTWQDLSSTIALIEQFRKTENCDPFIIISPTEDNDDICGTYVHRDLCPLIACWISPSFALTVSRIVNNYINSGHNNSNTNATSAEVVAFFEECKKYQTAEMTNCIKETAKFKAECEQMELRCKTAQTKILDVTTECRNITNECTSLRVKNMEINADLCTLKTENMKLKADVITAKEDATVARAAAEASRRIKIEAEREMDVARGIKLEAERCGNTLNKKIDKLQKAVNKVYDVIYDQGGVLHTNGKTLYQQAVMIMSYLTWRGNSN